MKAILGILLGALNLFVSVMVLMMGWNWFIAPLGVINLTFMHTLGLSFLVGAMSNYSTAFSLQRIERHLGTTSSDDTWVSASVSIVVRLLLLLFMYITTLSM